MEGEILTHTMKHWNRSYMC